MGVSLRAYARMRGCSLTAVQKAISSKRITPLADGTIDPERANQEWAKNTFAGQTIHKPSAASSDRLPPVHESAAFFFVTREKVSRRPRRSSTTPDV